MAVRKGDVLFVIIIIIRSIIGYCLPVFIGTLIQIINFREREWKAILCRGECNCGVAGLDRRPSFQMYYCSYNCNCIANSYGTTSREIHQRCSVIVILIFVLLQLSFLLLLPNYFLLFFIILITNGLC